MDELKGVSLPIVLVFVFQVMATGEAGGMGVAELSGGWEAVTGERIKR